MKLKVSDSVLSIAPYVPGKPMAELERELGISESIKLASNENPMGPSPLVKKALQDAIEALNRYPDGGGWDLVQKLSVKLSVAADQIVLGAGSDDIIGMLTRALLMPGDEVIIPKPSFLMYDIMVRSASAKPVYVPLKDLAIDLEGMAAGISKETRMVFLTNPNNPTGTCIDKDAFERFVNALPADVVIVVDEAYVEFVRDSTCVESLRYVDDDRALVVLRTFSKAYGLAGLRIGYGIMPTYLASLLHRVRQPFNVNSLAQAAASTALDDTAFLEKTVKLVHTGIDTIAARMEKIAVRHFPSQANFLLIDVGRRADEVYERLLREGVIVRSMTSYGFPTYIRVTAGLPEENERFVEALEAVLKE
ncbi:MAG: histidinol-phosphate transaminase [Deltaproteobacteria bacterium]|nr:histidinol-phosphate transaminase [Deltaproteobacteria bacterium]